VNVPVEDTVILNQAADLFNDRLHFDDKQSVRIPCTDTRRRHIPSQDITIGASGKRRRESVTPCRALVVDRNKTQRA
jgi:hypothetical protein